MVGGDVEVEEGVPPPWIRMVKKSSFADGHGGGEEGGVAPPWVRMVRKRAETGSRVGSSYRPGLWGLAAIRALRKRELGENDKTWMLRMAERDGD